MEIMIDIWYLLFEDSLERVSEPAVPASLFQESICRHTITNLEVLTYDT